MIWIFIQYCNTSNAKPTDSRINEQTAHGSQPRRKSWTFQVPENEISNAANAPLKDPQKSENKTLKSRGFTRSRMQICPGKHLRNDLSIVQVIPITPWKKITAKTPSTSRHRVTQRNLPFEIPYIKILLAWLKGVISLPSPKIARYQKRSHRH